MMDYRKYDELVGILEDMNVGFTKIDVEVYDDIVFYIIYLDGFDYGDYAGGGPWLMRLGVNLVKMLC